MELKKTIDDRYQETIINNNTKVQLTPYYLGYADILCRKCCDLLLSARGLRLRAHGLPLRAHRLLLRARGLPLSAHRLLLVDHIR